jgi:hypothetical protein
MFIDEETQMRIQGILYRMIAAINSADDTIDSEEAFGIIADEIATLRTTLNLPSIGATRNERQRT